MRECVLTLIRPISFPWKSILLTSSANSPMQSRLFYHGSILIAVHFVCNISYQSMSADDIAVTIVVNCKKRIKMDLKNIAIFLWKRVLSRALYNNYMSQCMRFPSMWYVRPAKPQIRLHICAVWSESLLVTWVFYDWISCHGSLILYRLTQSRIIFWRFNQNSSPASCPEWSSSWRTLVHLLATMIPCRWIFSAHFLRGNYFYLGLVTRVSKRAQWLSGRVLDWRPRGGEFEPHRRHCFVVLEQDTFILA